MEYLYIIKTISIFCIFLNLVQLKNTRDIEKKYYAKKKVRHKNISKIFLKYEKVIKYAGYISESEIRYMIFMKYIAPLIICFLTILINMPNYIYGVYALLSYEVVFSLLIKKRISERTKVIEFNGYKIFKFILNQLSSGVLISDTIKSMYMVVTDTKLKSCLIDVSAYFIQTSDIVLSLDILKSQYRGIEVDTLCIAISQGMDTGKNLETMERMEVLLFKKYVFHIKRETESKRHLSFFAVLLFCAIVVLMLSIPMLLDIFDAFNKIFI